MGKIDRQTLERDQDAVSLVELFSIPYTHDTSQTHTHKSTRTDWKLTKETIRFKKEPLILIDHFTEVLSNNLVLVRVTADGTAAAQIEGRGTKLAEKRRRIASDRDLTRGTLHR